MNFKTAQDGDMKVFLNADEFADVVSFQGKSILAVMSKNSEEALSEWRKRSGEPPDVGVQFLTLSGVVKDVGQLYAADMVTLDATEWTVLSVAEDAGVRTVHLYRHES